MFRSGEAWIPCPAEGTSTTTPEVEDPVDTEDPVEPPPCRDDQERCYINFPEPKTPHCCCRVPLATEKLDNPGKCTCPTSTESTFYRLIGDKCEINCFSGYELKPQVKFDGEPVTRDGKPVYMCYKKCSEGYELKGGECVKEETCYNFCEVDLGNVKDMVSRPINAESDANCRNYLMTQMRDRIQNTLNIREALSSSQISQMAKVSQTTTMAGPVVSNTLTGESGKTESDQVWTKFSDEPWIISIDGDCTIDESTYLCTQCQERYCRGARIPDFLGGGCAGDSYACRIKGLNKGSIACPLKARSMRKCCTSTGSNKL